MNGSEATLAARVGVDLSKRVYQVHAVDRSGKVLRPSQCPTHAKSRLRQTSSFAIPIETADADTAVGQ
jgi:hypothetical protein